MIHTNTKAIAKFLDEFIAGSHHCCADAATEAWTKLLAKNDRFQDLITHLVYRSCEQEMDGEAILTFSEAYAPLIVKLVIASLAIGTTAGISTVYTAALEAEFNLADFNAIFEKIIGRAIKSGDAAFMKPGSKGTV